MGIFTIFAHNKINGPEFVKPMEDSKQLNQLNELLDNVGDDQKPLLEKEIALVSTGLLGEKNVSYELTRNKKDMLILHDITLKNYDSDSQIDFIVFTKSCAFILETKRLNGDIEINSDGEFTRIFKNASGQIFKKEGIYSPITQNQYHIDAIEKLLKSQKMIRNYPLISLVIIANPKTVVNKTYAKKEVKDCIVKYDQLNNKIYELMDKYSEFDLSDNRLLDMAAFIMDNDSPREYNYVEKFNLVLKQKETLIDTKPIESIDVIDSEFQSKEYSNDETYEALREYRFKKSKELGYKPYLIFNNDQLAEVVLKMPKTKEEIIAISGFGEKKFVLYGQDILDIINSSLKTESTNTEVVETIKKETKVDSTESKEEKPVIGKLKKYRWDKSQELNYRPYMIFTNDQMYDMVEKNPKTKEELAKTPSFGQKKADLYGDAILEILKEFNN